jgi:outer membrane lipoprotein SlyB
MKRLILALSLAAIALSGCAELKNAFTQTDAYSGASAVDEQRPYPKSSSELGLGI